MTNEENSFENITREATNQVLNQRQLSNRIRVFSIAPSVDRDLFTVGLKEKVGETVKYHSFKIGTAQAFDKEWKHTIEGVKPLVDREILRLFPDRN